jgi:GNAT superfamily N-acetyltransferase
MLDGVAYALYRPSDDGWEGPAGGVYLRQLFVCRAKRRRGVGRAAVELLREEVWPRGCRVTLETLLHNEPARAFWRSLGFREYSIAFES